MADRWAVATGNWSNTATWNGGTLPTAADDVFADGFTVTIDQNVTVLSIRTTQRSGGTAGGGFTLSAGITVNANVISGTTICVTRTAIGAASTINGNLTAGPATALFVNAAVTVNIVGNVTGGSGNTTHGIGLNSGGSVTIVGNITGGTNSNSAGIRNDSSGTINVTGNVIGGPSSVNVWGIYGIGTGNIIVTGNVTGSSGGSESMGIRWQQNSGTLTVNGNVTGGTNSGINVQGTGQVTINGDCIASSATHGVANSIGATVIHNGNNISSSAAIVGILSSKLLIPAATTIYHSYRVNNSGSPGVERSLYTGGQNLGQPTAANVRQGTAFGVSNEFTGTLVVPNPQYVSAGVLTDNTVGTLQHLTLSTLQAALSPNSPVAVERSVDDTKAIVFSWPVSGATIAGQKSVDNGAYTAVVGSISFLRTESGRHYYTLAYNAADRVTQEATIRYSMTDGTYTKYFNLRLVPPGINQSGVRSAVGLATANLDTQLGNIRSDAQNIQTRLPASLVNGRINASVGSMEANTLNASALASDAVTEIQAGLATSNQISNLANNLPTEAY